MVKHRPDQNFFTYGGLLSLAGLIDAAIDRLGSQNMLATVVPCSGNTIGALRKNKMVSREYKQQQTLPTSDLLVSLAPHLIHPRYARPMRVDEVLRITRGFEPDFVEALHSVSDYLDWYCQSRETTREEIAEDAGMKMTDLDEFIDLSSRVDELDTEDRLTLLLMANALGEALGSMPYLLEVIGLN